MAENSNYPDATLPRDKVKNLRETNKYPSMPYEKYLQSTRLVNITGALAKKEKERS